MGEAPVRMTQRQTHFEHRVEKALRRKMLGVRGARVRSERGSPCI
jgi:hypothetical protein